MILRRSSGFSLVELMVGMTLALMLATIIGSIYLSGRQTSRVADTMGRMQESARFALQTIEEDIRISGFRGCNSAANLPVNTLNFPTNYANRFDQPLFGYHASGSTWAPLLDSSISALIPAPATGRDVITIKRIYGNGSALTAEMGSTTGALTVDSSAASTFAKGDFILVANCDAQAVFQITSSPTAGSIAHAATTAVVPGNATADLGHVFNTDASAYRLITKTYYIAPSARKPNTKLNSLWSYSVPDYTGSGQPQELVEGVDNLALLYGEDTDGDQSANRYVTADNVGNWNNVVSVRLQVLMETV
ncbi:MAG: PilW family protein, partial [Dyella sp.]|nr:PilW family protein [Dyella sp.]MBV8271709.1 PilW family protein [Cupriavidus sp.]